MSKTTILYKDMAPGAAADASFTSTAAASFSDLGLADDYESAHIATGELNAWTLDGTAELLDSRKVPFWSSSLSGADGSFSAPPVIEIAFDSQYTAVGATLVFSQAAGEFCRSVNIKWYQGAALKADKDFLPDGPVYYCQQNVSSYDRIVITLKATNLPYRYAKLEQVLFGVLRTFDMTEIRNAKITNQLNLISAEVPVSTLNWTLDSRDHVDYIFQLKQPMEVRNDGYLIGVYYINEHSRTAERLYSLSCQDAFGVRDGATFDGGVYSGKSAKALLSEIVGGDFTVSYTSGVADALLTGVLLPATKRASIQQVLFAWGVCAATDGVDGIRVFTLNDMSTVIDTDHTYTGASITTSAIVTQVKVTAHTYTQDSSGSVEIGGVKYKDTPTVYEVSNPDVTANDKKNVVEVTGATLVSTTIGQAVAQRVYDYYAMRNTAKAKIVWAGELLGNCVTVPNAWDETSTGNISKMDIALSNTVAANCEIPS